MKESALLSLQPAITIKELYKSFDDQPVLKGINLDVFQGESLVIFGPNGAGKTTLIKILSSIIKQSSGSITVNGMGADSHAEEIRRYIGVVTHSTFLYGYLSAAENLEFYCQMYDVAGIKTRINEVAEIVGINAYLTRRVDTLSRGMQQRISIARSLLHNPTIMLFDEAESSLDQQAISTLWGAIKGANNKKRTIIFTTHNLDRGFELSDRIVMLCKGKIVYEKQKQDVDINNLKEDYSNYTGAKT